MFIKADKITHYEEYASEITQRLTGCNNCYNKTMAKIAWNNPEESGHERDGYYYNGMK